VLVVSGLALGIDGAAHRGALSEPGASPVAVVGSGLDVIYPRGNADLWRQIADQGTILSEAPLGGGPEPWRFPARNRIIAALADVIVVVESKATGGSMITVDEGIRRGRPVLAVPGSLRNPAAAGTNLLISEGCAPVCAIDDVLVALDLATAGPGRQLLTEEGAPCPLPATNLIGGLSPIEGRVLAAVDFAGVTFDELSNCCDLAVGLVGAAVVTLEQRGLVSLVDGLARRCIAPTTRSGGSADTGGDPISSEG
jgi:DNA processing protein